MQSMMLMMPIMMLIMTWVTNGGIALYFFVGALVMIIQTLIIIVWRPKLRAQVTETFVVKDVVDDALAGRLQSEPTGPFAEAMKAAQAQQQGTERKDITGNVSESDTDSSKSNGRNAGKQKR